MRSKKIISKPKKFQAIVLANKLTKKMRKQKFETPKISNM